MQNPKTKPNSRALRKNPTKAEQTLWLHLRRRNLLGQKFRRQHPLGNYIVDFVCLQKKLVLELDGGQHAKKVDYDTQRTAWLEQQGFRVLRFWNHEVLQETEAVVRLIADSLEKR